MNDDDEYDDDVIDNTNAQRWSATSVAAGDEPGLLGETRKKLLIFLETSDYYRAESLLAKFPPDG